MDGTASPPPADDTLDHFEEEAYPEDPIDTVETLKEKQHEAIENLDFQYARELQAQIDALSSDNSLSKIDEYKKQLTDSLTKCARTNRRLRTEMLQKLHSEELEERIHFNDALNEMKQVHLREMKALEEKLFLLYKETMMKPIALYDELIERAKLTAMRCEFQKAQDYQDQADAAKEAEEHNREEIFKEVYKSRMGQIFERHKGELRDLTAQFNLAVETVQKRREEAIQDRAKAYRREMQKAYQKVVDTITRAKYNPRKAKQTLVNRKMLPELLNEIEDEYKQQLVKWGLEEVEVGKKPKLLAPGVRPESQMSLRMQSRLENRENEKKKRDEERISRMSERAASKQGSRSPSQQSPNRSPQSKSPRGASRSGTRKSE